VKRATLAAAFVGDAASCGREGKPDPGTDETEHRIVSIGRDVANGSLRYRFAEPSAAVVDPRGFTACYANATAASPPADPSTGRSSVPAWSRREGTIAERGRYLDEPAPLPVVGSALPTGPGGDGRREEFNGGGTSTWRTSGRCSSNCRRRLPGSRRVHVAWFRDRPITGTAGRPVTVAPHRRRSLRLLGSVPSTVYCRSDTATKRSRSSDRHPPIRCRRVSTDF
jgi:hypothetical protein